MVRKDPKPEKLIDPASMDTDPLDDVARGLCCGIRKHVRFPLTGTVVGGLVSVIGVEEGQGVDVVAICERNGRTYRVRLDDITIKAHSIVIEWIDLYRYFKSYGE